MRRTAGRIWHFSVAVWLIGAGTMAITLGAINGASLIRDRETAPVVTAHNGIDERAPPPGSDSKSAAADEHDLVRSKLMLLLPYFGTRPFGGLR